MAVDFSDFTASNTIPSTAHLVGYDVLASGGEKRWTLATVANAVSGVMTAQLNNAFFNTTDVIPIAKGGTGQTTAFAGLVALANGGASTASKYLKVNAGNTALEYDTINLASTDVTGVLPIANGGTGGSTGGATTAKAWVNFNGLIDTLSNLENGGILTPTNGGNTVNFYSPTGIWTNSSFIGVVYQILNIGGSSSGTLGGIPCSQLYLQLQSITNVNNAVFKLVNSNGTNTSTTFTSSAIVTGNGTSSGAQYCRTGIRSSYNVSSVTKNGTGDYTINFATAMANANYVTVATGGLSTGIGCIGIDPTSPPTTASVRVQHGHFAGSGTTGYPSDTSYANVVIFGN